MSDTVEYASLDLFNKAPSQIMFHNAKGEVVGTIDLDTNGEGKVTFSGDVEDSAQALFDCFIGLINENVRRPLLEQIDQLNESLAESEGMIEYYKRSQ